MSSGFVSAGTVDNPVERDDEWKAAQAELAEKRRQKEAEGAQEGGKSLFEVLQANKAAKQDAFEEAARLKNQYRALDDSEAEFLDSVLESTRKQEEEIRKQTLDSLDLFRKHQEEEERKTLLEQNAGSPPAEEKQQWGVTRKRKKASEKDGGLLKGVKLRKASSGAVDVAEVKKGEGIAEDQGKIEDGRAKGKEPVKEEGKKKTASGAAKPTIAAKSITATSPPTQASKSLSLSLGYASSDDDD